MEMTKEQINSLVKFALDILGEWPDATYLDGGDIQEIAEKHKLLIPHTVYKPCCEEGCECAEVYTDKEWQEGVTCYRLPEWLTRDAQQRNEAERAVGERDS